MILYYAPGGCSQASHIALREAGMLESIMRVGRDKRAEDGKDFLSINPKGYTPALQLDDGTMLTESLVILSYIAEKSGKLLASEGMDRWRALEALEFMTTEVHGKFRVFFNPASADGEKASAGETLAKRFATLAEQLGDRDHLVGNLLTIADIYLFVMLGWAAMMGITVPDNLAAFLVRMKGLPSVANSLSAEGFA